MGFRLRLNWTRFVNVTAAVTAPMLMLVLAFLGTTTTITAAAQALGLACAANDGPRGTAAATARRDGAIRLAIHFCYRIQVMMIAAVVVVPHRVLQLRRNEQTVSLEQALQLFGL